MNRLSRSWALAVVLLTDGCGVVLAPNPEFDGDAVDPESEFGSESESESESGFDGDRELVEDTPDDRECWPCPHPIVITGLEDTYTDNLLEWQNFGDQPSLRVDDHLDSFLRLPNLAGIPDGTRLESLTLTLSCTEAEGPIQLRAVAGSWAEATLTAAGESSLWTWYMGWFEPQIGENVIELIDMLEFWQFDQSNPSIELRATYTSASRLTCDSREGPLGPRFTMIVQQ